MGLYDRDYYREPERGQGFDLFGSKSAVATIIILNFIVWGIDALSLLFGHQPWLYEYTAGRYYDLFEPWMWWRVVTLAFTHSPNDPWHIIFNMLVLFFFGREIEQRFGKAEFWRTYLVAVVFTSLVGLVYNYQHMVALLTPDQMTPENLDILGTRLNLGASGAVMAVLMMFAVLYPTRTVYLYFIVPIPIWLLVAIIIAIDLVGLRVHDGISHSAHLAGLAYGFCYIYFGWNWGQMLGGRMSSGQVGRRGLRLHDPKPTTGGQGGAQERTSMDEEVDRILEKLAREGEASLTDQERKTLEDASRYYQRRRR